MMREEKRFLRLIAGPRLLLIIGTAIAPVQSSIASGDHHMHIYSEDGTRVWAAMCELIADGCADEPPVPTTALTSTAAVHALDNAGIEKGAILSLAYYYGFPPLAGGEFDDHAYVRAENEFVAEQVSRFPDRLVGFFSVNPLAEYAVPEVTYWATRNELTGLKLHLTNSDVDFANPEHMDKLAAVIGVMNDHNLPVLIHLRSRDPDYGYQQAALFIDQVARHAPAVTFQLAHMGGWGRYDQGTDGAVQAFLDAIENGLIDRSKVWFDVAAVVKTDLSDDIVATLRRRFREIGFDRLLFASDWDEVEPDVYIDLLKQRLQLSDEDMEQLMKNEAPYLN